jgi:hypothetical protein
VKTLACDLCDRIIGRGDCEPGVTTYFHGPVPHRRRLDVCADCAEDLIDLMTSGGAGWSACPACGGPLATGSVAVVATGPWDFRVLCGPAGVVLLPKETPAGCHLVAACEQVAGYISRQHTSCDGYDIAIGDLYMALAAAFQVEEPG